MPAKQRRTVERFAMHLPALVSFTENRKNLRPIGLLTEDISSKGAFFRCTNPLAVNTRVKVAFFIPVQGASSEGSQVKVSGTVIRTDYRGMAIQFDKHFQMTSMTAASA